MRDPEEAKQIMGKGRTQLTLVLLGKKEPPQFESLLRQLHDADGACILFR